MTSMCRATFSIMFAAALLCVLCWTTDAEVVVKSRSPSQAQSEALGKPVPMNPTTFYFAVKMPLSKLQVLANQYDMTLHRKGVLYDLVITIQKNVTLDLSGDEEFPIRLKAPFKLKGTIAGAKIDTLGEASLDLTFQIGGDWCPVVKLDKPSVILSAEPPAAARKEFKRGFSDFIATSILSNELNNWATCDNIKAAIAEVWHPISSEIKFGPKTFYIKLDPNSLAVSEFAVAESTLRFTAALSGEVSVSSKAGRSNNKSLPEVGPNPSLPSGTNSDIQTVVSFNPNLQLP